MAKIAFVQQEMREYISTMLMSAKLKEAGHQVEVFILPQEKGIYYYKKLYEYNPDIIGFSSTTISFADDLKILKRILYPYVLNKKTKPFIIFGGAHPTYNPEKVIKHNSIDAICIGEGLDAIVELANKLDNEDDEWFLIENLWIKNITHDYYKDHICRNPIRSISNINDWPRPDYALYYDKYEDLRNKPTKPAYIVRGCPYQCAFCYNPAFNEMYKEKCFYPENPDYAKRRIFQCMDVDKAISEIKWLKETYGFTYLQFLSDNMTINKKWFKEFLEKYKKDIKITAVKKRYITKYDSWTRSIYKTPQPFFMNCRANEVTKEIVDILKESGCNRVDFGVEHGNDFIRNDILNRNMSKEQIIQCGKWFKEAGIRVQTTNIFGLPHEDFNKAWESVELNRQFTPEISKACILQPFENTQIYNYAKENKLLKDNLQYSGTTYQIGVKDNRSEETKIKVKNEKQIIKLSRLFDWFVKHPAIPKWIGFIICSLPFSYKQYYAKIFKEHGRKYKGIK